MTPAEKKATYYLASKLGLRNAVLLTSWWTDGDFMALVSMSATLGTDPYDLLVVMASEASLSPSARNPLDKSAWPVAVGLNQVTRVAAAATGLIPKEKTPGDGSNMADWKKYADAVVQMSVSQELPIVAAFYAGSERVKAGKTWPNAESIYAFNAAGITSDVTDATTVYPAGSPGYAGNAGLDIDGSGSVTVKDLRLQIAEVRTRPLYLAAFLRMGILALRAGHRKGFEDAQARNPANTTTFDSSFDAGMFAAAYEDGYRVGASSAVGTKYERPAYLSV